MTRSYFDQPDNDLRRVSGFVSDRCGLITNVILPELQSGDPPVAIALSSPARLAGSNVRAVNEGAGAALSPARAMTKAIGESIERYCAAFQPTGLPFSSARDIGSTALVPESFALFSSEQYAGPNFPFVPFTSTTRTRWVAGRSLVDGRSVHVPAAFVYLPYQRHPGESRLSVPVSTGLAAGPNLRATTASALLEVIERDAFMSLWLRRASTVELDLGSLPPGEERQLLRALRSTGLRCRVRLITQDIEVPVFLVVMEGEGRRIPHSLLLSGGANGDVRRALRAALEEACLSLFGLNRLVERLGDEVRNLPAIGLKNLGLQSVAYAIDPGLKEAAAFLLSSECAPVSVDALIDRFEAVSSNNPEVLVASLRQWAPFAAVVTCTTEDVAAMGIHVVRVVVPGLRPLDHDHSLRHLGGMARRFDAFDGPLNNAPHPFP